MEGVDGFAALRIGIVRFGGWDCVERRLSRGLEGKTYREFPLGFPKLFYPFMMFRRRIIGLVAHNPLSLPCCCCRKHL